MTVSVNASSASGKVSIIPSKSVAHRLLICAALSDAPTEIVCNASSKDIEATVSCLRKMGAEIEEKNGIFKVNPIKKPLGGEIFCGESGSTLRFLIPVAAALGEKNKFTGAGRLPERPCMPLVEALRANGAEIEYEGKLPLEVSGGLKAGKFRIAGDISSQFITGLILALPLLEGESEIEITGKIESRPYIDITLDCIGKFGIDATFEGNVIRFRGGKYRAPKERLTVEGDWSNVAFWLCLGAMTERGITVSGLNPDSLQGDRAVAEILSRFGAEVSWKNGDITVRRGKLRAVDIDAAEIPDLVPALSVIAAVAEGKTRIYNAQRLRIKESDRIESTAMLLRSLGATVTETEDGLAIEGREKLRGGKVDSFNDHRIAMSAAVASAVAEGNVTISGAEAIRKSYGDFFEILSALGAEINSEEV